MTKIQYDSTALRMSIHGHAGAGEYGQDIVCAAESILMLVLEVRLKELEGENAVSVVKRYGQADIGCCPMQGCERRCRDVFEAVFLGYQLLEGMYPEYVRTEILK